MYDFTTIGAVVGLVIAIVLIIRKVHPAYSLILGALVGGIIGGGGLVTTVNTMVSGAQSMMSSVLRIMTSGILAGALIKTGSAQKIAETIVDRMGERPALAAIALATMIICAVGVFIDISVITVAPIALAIGKRAKLSKQSLLLAMIGGGKAGNIISPNPNTIAASEAFGVDLTSLMFKNIVPALFALAMAILLATFLSKKKNGLALRAGPSAFLQEPLILQVSKPAPRLVSARRSRPPRRRFLFILVFLETRIVYHTRARQASGISFRSSGGRRNRP